uniref:Uncharacterized protein n=1 Tax=Lepeophtheirus salmonis TaxID=72036 RepID=A0A0K2U6L5_LEPSM
MIQILYYLIFSFLQAFLLIPSRHLNDTTSIALMKKDIVVSRNSVLEVFFSALALGWKEKDSMFSSDNPVLEVIYDDVMVFKLDSAIRDNIKYFSPNKWNQFRLFSR